MKKLEAHLFICTNQRDKGKCCADRGGKQLREEVKSLAKKNPDWKGRVRVNSSGCLGRCDEGIVAVLYPEGKWFTELSEDDSAKLVKAIRESLK